MQQYTYNKAALLEQVSMQLRGSGAFEAYITNINYNARGQRTEVYFGNGSKTKYEYDANNFRLTRLLTTRNTGADILQDINYTYDAVGNIVEIIDNAQQTHYFSNSVIEPRQKFWYDALYRLTKATGREQSNLGMPTATDIAPTLGIPDTASNALQNYTQNYSYDKLGNLQNMQSTGNWTRDYVYDPNNANRLIKHDPQQTLPDYTYDSHGNMLQMPGIATMEWDYENQLHKAVCGTTTAYYTYTDQNVRARKIVEKSGGIKEERIYFGNYEIYRKFTNDILTTERKTVHITDGNKRIAMIDSLTVDAGIILGTPTDTIRYQYDNHLGSASLELDQTAATISYEEYHPFGTSSYRLHRNSTETSLKRYRYVGKERDEETGLYYYGARYYAAHIARFVSVDPLQDDYPYLTPYNYAGNKPVTHIDIDGMQGTGDKKFSDLLKNAHEKEMEQAKKMKTNAQEVLINIGIKAGDEFSKMPDDIDIKKQIKKISKKYDLGRLEKNLHKTYSSLGSIKYSYDLVNEEISKLEALEDKLVYTEKLLKEAPNFRSFVNAGDKIELLNTLDRLNLHITIKHNPFLNIKDHTGRTIYYVNSETSTKERLIEFRKQELDSIFNEIGDIFFKMRFYSLYLNDQERIKKALKNSPDEQSAYSKEYYNLNQEIFSCWLTEEAKKLINKGK